MKTTDRVQIGSATLRAAFAPAFGGRMVALQVMRPDGPFDVIVPMNGWTDQPWRWPKAGAYPLFPYSNRIRNARLAHEDRNVELKPHPDAAPHTLHGPAHLRPWHCVAQDETQATLALDYHGDADWPWSFRAEQRFAIAGNQLTLLLRLTNTATQAFPAGMGWHPYFSFGPDATITQDARTLWVQDETFIATGETRAAAPPHERTDYLSEWSGASILHRDGLRLDITADPIFAHLVCHRPDSDAYACIEPVTHGADGFNLAVQGIKGTGTTMLAPGASLSGKISVHVGLT